MRNWSWIRSWPLLIGAVICFAIGLSLVGDDTQRVYAATALLTIGAILIGGWIVLLVVHGHTGETPTVVEPPGADPPDSAGRPGPPDPPNAEG